MGRPKTTMLLSAALKTLLEKQSIQNISVRDICTLSGLSTRAFYNHFSDKFDLMYFLYHDMNEHCWFENGKLVCYYDACSRITMCLLDNWDVYRHMFVYAGQNNIRKFALVKSISNLNRLFLWNGHQDLVADDKSKERIFLVAHATLGLVDGIFCSPPSYSFSRDTILNCFSPEQMEALKENPLPGNPNGIAVYDKSRSLWPPKLYI